MKTTPAHEHAHVHDSGHDASAPSVNVAKALWPHCLWRRTADLVNNIVASFAEFEQLRPSCDTWTRAARNRMVRDLVLSIRWSPSRGFAGFTLDTIAIDNFIEQGGERFADLPARNSRGET